MLLLFMVACGRDDKIEVVPPDLVVDPSPIDFGEIVLGNGGAFTAKVRNDGGGWVTVTGATWADGASPDFTLTSFPDVELSHGDEADLVLSYAPDSEAEDYGQLQLTTNSEEQPTVEVDVYGAGVDPQIEVDPELLYFGEVTENDTYTLTTTIANVGSGTLIISHLDLEANDGAYLLESPAGWALPKLMAPGEAATFKVTFAPTDVAEHEDRIVIESNDRDDEFVYVELEGNSSEYTYENTAPIVEILDPNDGSYILDTEMVDLVGYVVDPDEPVINLSCSWFANSTNIGAGSIASDGTVTGAAFLPVGEADVTLRCYDFYGAMGEDSTVVTVWNSIEPLQYTISGGTSIFDYLRVDDDLAVYVNGTQVFVDDDNTQTTIAPFNFEAHIGDTIRIVATDENYCAMELGELYIHWGTDHSDKLTDGACDSACPGDACYTGTYEGPWPGVYFDEEFTINIP